MPPRLLILGLDGAGYDFVSALCASGVMPNLDRLAKAGACGPLRSTTPPITGPSWLGLVSGLDVDQTGIADFLVRRSRLFDLKPIGSRDFEGRAIWDALSHAGARVAVFNFPILFPPYPINGVMVSGFGTDESTQWTYPESLKGELLDAVGADYNLTINYHHELYDDASRFLDDIERSLDRRLTAASLLCARERWDLFTLVLSETDWLLHRCWSDLDASHPRYDPNRSPRIAERIRGVWSTIDRAIPRLCESLGGDVNVLVCSDHGFGANRRSLKINALLEQAGLLVRKPASQHRAASIGRLGARIARRAGAAAARVPGAPGRALARARRRTRKYLPKNDSSYVTSVVDLERTAIFDPGHTIPFAGLYVVDSVDRGGVEYQAVLDRTEEALAAVALRSSLDVVAERTWLASASRVGTLPDLIVSADEWACTFLKTDFDGDPVVGGSFSPRHTGSHRQAGMYVASGPAILARPAGQSASILDIAPTILALFGLSSPQDRRGRALDVLTSMSATLTPALLESQSRASDGDDDDDDGDVRERLRGLGYIE